MSYWPTIKSIAIILGPLLLPRALNFYRTQRNAAAIHGLQPRTLPEPVYNSLLLLGALTTYYLIALVFLAPENIFTLTESRLQITPDVLFKRFSSTIRPLTEDDKILRARFASMESRLLYLKYGPEVLTSCTFCTSERPLVYFLYALPSILTPHLFNIFILALITSPLLSGRFTSRFRSPIITASLVFTVIDVYTLYSHPHQENAKALRLSELNMYHWRSRNLRFFGLGILNCIFAIVFWLSATNRAFVTPPPPAMRVEAMNKNLMGVLSKLNAVGILRNTVVRSRELREHANTYWGSEVKVTNELLEDEEVKDSIEDAMENNRIDVKAVTESATQYASNILGPWLAQAEAKARSEQSPDI